MPSLILDFLNFNKNIDYAILLPLAVIYVFVFWAIVSGWVFIDATKRTKSKTKGILIGVGNIIFGVPFLILYLLIRPSDFDLDFESESNGGVNVPVVNFVGKDGMVMSLELRINSAKLAQENASEMKVDVSFDSQDDNKKIINLQDNEPEIVITQTVKGPEIKTENKSIRKKLASFKNAFSKVIKNQKLEEKKEVKTETEPENKDEQLQVAPQKKNKKKNKKHR